MKVLQKKEIIVYISLAYMITIVIHVDEICTENIIKWIVCLEPGREIDGNAY